MIHFNFIVEDEEAEEIYECMKEGITQAHLLAMKALIKKDDSEYRYYLKYIEYLEAVKKKMHNTRVPKDDNSSGTEL